MKKAQSNIIDLSPHPSNLLLIVIMFPHFNKYTYCSLMCNCNKYMLHAHHCNDDDDDDDDEDEDEEGSKQQDHYTTYCKKDIED